MSRLVSTCLIATSMTASASIASADTYRWIGLGMDKIFSNPLNWEGGVAPVSSPDTTLIFPTPSATGFYYPLYRNDIEGLSVGTIIREAGWLQYGFPIRLHHLLDDRETRANLDVWELECVGNVTLISGHPAPAPGSDPATTSVAVSLSGTGRLRFEGGWAVRSITHYGDITVAPGALLAFGSQSPISFESLDVQGTMDAQAALSLRSSRTLDLSRGVLDLGRADNTALYNLSGRLQFDGSIILGEWAIQSVSYDPDRPNDRIDVTETLDLTRTHVVGTPTAELRDIGRPPAYLVLASYGNRIGELDASSAIFHLAGQAPQSYPIIYTSAENAGPGEIRVLLPEPSILVTCAAASLLKRRRREE